MKLHLKRVAGSLELVLLLTLAVTQVELSYPVASVLKKVGEYSDVGDQRNRHG